MVQFHDWVAQRREEQIITYETTTETSEVFIDYGTTTTTTTTPGCIHQQTTSEQLNLENLIIDLGETEGTEVEIIIEQPQQIALPFSLCPGEFWADAIRTVYGPRHLLLGYGNSFELRVSNEGETIEVGPTHTGLVVEIGKGECETINGEQFFRVNLDLVDYKLTNADSTVRINYDAHRGAEKCVIVAKNVHRILAKFAKFSNQVNWESLVAEYNISNVEFYKQYIEMFYPATIHIGLNTTTVIDWSSLAVSGFSGVQTLINKKTTWIVSKEILNWPPPNVDFAPREPLELVTVSGGYVVTRFEAFTLTFIFPFITEQIDVVIMDNLLKTGSITFEYVLTMVTKYFLSESHPDIVTELPFPINPVQFWIEAIKTIYGHNHLLLGISHQLRIVYGTDPADVGSLLSGLAVQLVGGSDENDRGKPEFRLNFSITDLKMVSRNSGIAIEFDTVRGGEFSLTAVNTQKIADVFRRFSKRVTWRTLVAEYEQNRVRFYKKYLELFLQAKVNFNVNIRTTVDGSLVDLPGFEIRETFINREKIVFTETVVNRFPPTDFVVGLQSPIELVHVGTPSTTVIVIEKFNTTLNTPEYNTNTETTTIHETITTTLTFEFIIEKVTKYVVTKLPFPNTPAQFWAEAIKTIYGKRHLLVGSSDGFLFQKPDGTVVEIGVLHNGFILDVQDGVVEKFGDKTLIRLNLDLIDFKMSDTNGRVEIELDTNKKKEQCFLILEHGNELIQWFTATFQKELDYLTLIDKFYASPKKFYEEYIHKFYPAVLQIGLNIRKVVDGAKISGIEGTLTFVNKETLWLTSGDILNFPPSQIEIGTPKPVSLTLKNAVTEYIITLPKFSTDIIHIRIDDGHDGYKNYLSALNSGITFDFVRITIVNYILIEETLHPHIKHLPFPTDPVEFWVQAIKTLYGEKHFLLGLVDTYKYKGPDNKLVNLLSLFNGLTFKIKEPKKVAPGQPIQISFVVGDYTLSSKDGTVKITNDHSKPGEEITITVKDTTKITEVFEKFQKRTNWPTLIEEYTRSPELFYKQYITYFFPANIQILLNLKKEINRKVYVTTEIVTIVQEIKEFPPTQLVITPQKPIKFVNEKDPKVVIWIQDWSSKVTYPKVNDRYDIQVINEIFEVEFTYQVVHQKVIHYVIVETLPFSVNPGTFWADAIRTIYGENHLLFGVSKSTNIRTPDGKVVDIGVVLKGLTFKINEGLTVKGVTDEDDSIQVYLELKDLKTVSAKPGLLVELDDSRPGEDCILKVKTPSEVFTKFYQVFNEKNWEVLIYEYEQSPKKFYLKYIGLFFPATVTFSFNVRVNIDGSPVKVPVIGTDRKNWLVNRELIVIKYETLREFPPNDIFVSVHQPIELVERYSPDKVIVTLEKSEIRVIHQVFTQKVDITAWQKVVEFGLTIEFIRKYLNKYVTTTTTTGYTETIIQTTVFTAGVPFPLCPGEFWAEAVRTVYGSKHLLLGHSDTLIWGVTPVKQVFSGIILQVVGGSCFDEGQHIKLTFKVFDYKVVRQDGGLQIVQDPTRKRIVTSLISLNGVHVNGKFNQFANPLKWKSLTTEFRKDKVAFYKKHLPAFYPAVFQIGLDVKYLIDGSVVDIGVTGKKIYINRDLIWFTSDKILNFPPASLKISPRDPQVPSVVVDKTNTTLIINEIRRFETDYVTLRIEENEPALLVIQEIIKTGLTYEFIREYVLKYILKIEEIVVIPVLPFPSHPVKFWEEAITVVFGDRHLFFGLNQNLKVKGPNGQVVVINNAVTGVTFKLRQVVVDTTVTTVDDIKVIFDIVEYKKYSFDGDIEFVHDTTKGNELVLTVKDITRVEKAFLDFRRDGTWQTVVEEYNTNKVNFFEKYLEFFYPATVTLTLNFKVNIKETFAVTLGFTGPQTLVSKTVAISTEVKQFPLFHFEVVAPGPVELLDVKTSTVVVVVENIHTVYDVPVKNNVYDLVFVKEIFVTGLTYVTIKRYIVTQVIARRLPFPLDAGKFFAEAIKVLYGGGTLLLGADKIFQLKLTDGVKVNVGPLLNGLVIKIKEGFDETNGEIRLYFTVVDFKQVRKNGGIRVEIDRTQPEGENYFVVENREKITQKFSEISTSGKWDVLVQEYNTDRLTFYEKYLQYFFPITLKAQIHLKYTIDGVKFPYLGINGEQFFFNKEVIQIITTGITEFPPKNIQLKPTHPIELIGIESEKVVFVIEDHETIWTHPLIKDQGDLIVIQTIINTGLTFEYIRETVTKYIIIDHTTCITIEELPFPLCPGEFWAKAIQVIYGETQFLLGQSEEFVVVDVDGKPITNEPALTGLTIKLVQGSCGSLGPHELVKVHFDILDYKVQTKGGNLTIEYDPTRKGGEAILETKDVTKILAKFNEFSNPYHWVTLNNEFKELGPVEFYKKYISIFYPASFKIALNVKRVTVEETTTTVTTVVNRDLVVFVVDELLNFPPSSLDLTLPSDLVFVEEHNRTHIVIRITKYVTTIIHLRADLEETTETQTVIEIIRTGYITFEKLRILIIVYVTKEPEVVEPQVPFPTDPVVFWQTALSLVLGKTPLIFLGLSEHFTFTYTDGTPLTVGPLLSGFIFKNVEVTTPVEGEWSLKFEIVDWKSVSSEGTLEIEVDRPTEETVVGYLVVTTTQIEKITELFVRFKTSTNWVSLSEEYNLSPVKFYRKYLEVYYPATFTVTITNLQFKIGGTRTLVIVDNKPLVITGESTSYIPARILLKLTETVHLVEVGSPTIVATITEFVSRWTIPVIRSEEELHILFEIINSRKLTYIIVREKVTKYLIADRLPFPLCPGEFFAQAIRVLYGDGQLFLGFSPTLEITTDDGKTTLDLGPLLSGLTLRILEGTSWEYTHDKSVRIRFKILDFKSLARDGGLEIELDRTGREAPTDGYIVVRETTKLLEAFASFFHEDNWDSLAKDCKQNPRAFYAKYLALFFPASIKFGIHVTYTFEQSLLKRFGITVEKPKVTYYTKQIVQYYFKHLNDYPREDMMIQNQNVVELIELSNPNNVVFRIQHVKTVWMYPQTTEKADQAVIQEIIVSGFTFQTVYEQVNRYVVIKLPFPTDPAVFWIEAIRTIYGDKHLLLGLADKPNIAHPDEKPMEIGPIRIGLITTLGTGHTVEPQEGVAGDTGAISIDLNLLDIKWTNWNGDINLQLDTSQSYGSGSLVSREPAKVFARFAQFGNPANWEALIADYEASPRKFYEKEVQVFYPAKLSFPLGLTATIGGGKNKIKAYKGSVNLITKQAFTLVSTGIPYYPPQSFYLTPSTVVELVDLTTHKVCAKITKKTKLLWTHPSVQEKSEAEICIRAVETGISYDYVRQMVNTYMNVPKYEGEVKVIIDWVEA